MRVKTFLFFGVGSPSLYYLHDVRKWVCVLLDNAWNNY